MAATGTSLRALRDRAVLLLGFAGAFRRSELVALDVRVVRLRKAAPMVLGHPIHQSGIVAGWEIAELRERRS